MNGHPFFILLEKKTLGANLGHISVVVFLQHAALYCQRQRLLSATASLL
jgi:hypothetical protein